MAQGEGRTARRKHKGIAMEVKRLNVAVVILADAHNPSILHPSFLASRGIMKEGEELEEEPLCTPPFSIVKYKNGLTFSAEQNKFQVLRSSPPEDWAESQVPDLASRYVEELPHVRYTAVGINFSVLLKPKDPRVFLIEKFVKRENAEKAGMTLGGLGIRLAYPLEEVLLNLTCDLRGDHGAGREEKGGSGLGVLVSANYHRDLVGKVGIKDVVDAIRAFSVRRDHFETVVLKEILGIRGVA